jgi:endonuclease I
MEAMRESWTDERLDDLNHRSEEGFKRVEADLHAHRLEAKTEVASLRNEMNERFDKVDQRFDKVDARFGRIDQRFAEMEVRFDSIQRMILQVGGGIVASIMLLALTSHL